LKLGEHVEALAMNSSVNDARVTLFDHARLANVHALSLTSPTPDFEPSVIRLE
jgi:hypothetical protein